MLDTKSSNAIVNRLSSVFDKDINIIGMDGIIIASSNIKRINTFHEGGRICINSNRNVIITESNTRLFRGCKPGVNLALRYRNQVVGAIGITGEEEEVLPYGPIIKELVEVILGELENTSKQQRGDRVIVKYIKEVIRGIEKEDLELYRSQGELLGINSNQEKRLVLLKVDGHVDFESLDEIIHRGCFNAEIIYCKLDDKTRVLVIPVKVEVSEWIRNRIEAIKSVVKERYTFCISDRCKRLEDYSREYKKLCKVQQLCGAAPGIVWAKDYELQLMISGVAVEAKAIYLHKYESMNLTEKLKDESDIMHTIKVYFEKNMRLLETAQAMFVHKNTVAYRLNRFKESTGIDITKPLECSKIYLAILMHEQMREWEM